VICDKAKCYPYYAGDNGHIDKPRSCRTWTATNINTDYARLPYRLGLLTLQR
jgi:hypothetical protein